MQFEVRLNNWTIEYPEVRPIVKITFMKVKRDHTRMVSIEFSRIDCSEQDFLQQFKNLKDCIDEDIDADTEDSDKEENQIRKFEENQEMNISDEEEVKHCPMQVESRKIIDSPANS